MADNLRQMVGALRLHCPDLPYFLGAQFIRDRYRRALQFRNWSQTRGEHQLLLSASKTTGSVALTRGSASVVGTGTAWASTDVGRQFMANGRGPVYTISAVTDTTHITLDNAWGMETDADATYAVFDGYATLPTDFKQFIAILDPLRAWQLWFWVTQEDLNKRDPARMTVGDPWVLVDLDRSSAAATLGAPRFEVWPYNQIDRVYTIKYFKQLADLVDPDDQPMWPITGDCLVKGALADCAAWPGTLERPNPMFAQMQALIRHYESQFDDLLGKAEVEDENIMMTWLQSADWMSWPKAPIDAKWLQSHA